MIKEEPRLLFDSDDLDTLLSIGSKLVISNDYDSDVLNFIQHFIRYDAAIFVRNAGDRTLHITADAGLGTDALKMWDMRRDPLWHYVSKNIILPKSEYTKTLNADADEYDARLGFAGKKSFACCLTIAINGKGEGIRLFRKWHRDEFSEQDIRYADYLGSYLCTLDDRNREYRMASSDSHLLDLISERFYFGALLLDDSFKFIRANTVGLQRIGLITKKRNSTEAKEAFSQLVENIVSSDRSISPHIDFFDSVSNYLIEVMKCKDTNENGYVHTLYIVLLFEIEWFASLIRNSSSKIIQDYKLTNRETQTVELLMQGCSTRQISDKMCISPLTVKEHFKSIFRKMDVHSRSELLIKIYSDSGFISGIK